MTNYDSDWSVVDNVVDGSFKAEGASVFTAGAKLKYGSLTRADWALGQVLGLSPGDVILLAWKSTITGTITVGGRFQIGSVVYRILNATDPPDGAVARCVCRKEG